MDCFPSPTQSCVGNVGRHQRKDLELRLKYLLISRRQLKPSTAQDDHRSHPARPSSAIGCTQFSSPSPLTCARGHRFSPSPALRPSTDQALPRPVAGGEAARSTSPRHYYRTDSPRRRRGVRDAPAIADLGAAPTSPPGGVLRHVHSDLGRPASRDVLRAGSGGLTNHTTPSLLRQRLRAEVRVGPPRADRADCDDSERSP
jgi:hypothetical protein